MNVSVHRQSCYRIKSQHFLDRIFQDDRKCIFFDVRIGVAVFCIYARKIRLINCCKFSTVCVSFLCPRRSFALCVSLCYTNIPKFALVLQRFLKLVRSRVGERSLFQTWCRRRSQVLHGNGKFRWIPMNLSRNLSVRQQHRHMRRLRFIRLRYERQKCIKLPRNISTYPLVSSVLSSGCFIAAAHQCKRIRCVLKGSHLQDVNFIWCRLQKERSTLHEDGVDLDLALQSATRRLLCVVFYHRSRRRYMQPHR